MSAAHGKMVLVSDRVMDGAVASLPLASGVATPTPVEEEVACLFAQLRVPVLRYLCAFGISSSDAEEAAQEVFIALFQHLRQGKPRHNLQSWIFRVAHNIALKSRTNAKRHADRVVHAPNLADTAADANPGPEQALSERQRQSFLLAVVRALPEQDQWCLSLRAEGLRYREIAEVLGISLGTVAASLEKSLSRLTRAAETRATHAGRGKR